MAILVESDSACNFEDLPPTQRCIDSVYIEGCDRKRFSSAAFIKKRGHPVTWAGGRGFTAKIVWAEGQTIDPPPLPPAPPQTAFRAPSTFSLTLPLPPTPNRYPWRTSPTQESAPYWLARGRGRNQGRSEQWRDEPGSGGGVQHCRVVLHRHSPCRCRNAVGAVPATSDVVGRRFASWARLSGVRVD